MSDDLKKTPLHSAHLEAKGRMVPFAGYSMPVQYSGLLDEHNTVRNDVGLFDVSHMGEVMFTGPRALEVANRIVTNDLTKLVDGQAVYTVMVRPTGGIIDDLVAYRFSEEKILICVNAANRDKDFAWMKQQAGDDCQVVDESDDWVQIAVQGPKAAGLVKKIASNVAIDDIKTYHFAVGDVAGHSDVIVARTGYTGEDGFELYGKASAGLDIWNALLKEGADDGVKPCGLGARDTLRLEYCYALYGQDITEDDNPYQAGLGWVVKLKKGDFVGKEALEKIKADGPDRKLVPIEITGKGIGRQDYPITKNGEKIGRLTSGTKGPTVGKAVALGYVKTEFAKKGTELEVDIRGRAVPAVVSGRPFVTKN